MIDENVEVSENQVSNAETETPVEEIETAAGNEGNQQPEVSETNVDEKANPKRTYTKEEQQAYSFRKQLGKQKEKYENRYSELQNQYNELLERLNKLEHPEQFAPKTREQFATDDEFINHLVEERFNNVWNQKLAEAQKAYAEQSRQDQEISTYRTRADENVKRLFKTPEAEKQYRETIATAIQNGLGELVDSDKETAMYIMRSDLGPKILYELATKPEVVERLFNENVTDMDRQFLIRELEANIRKEMVTPPPVVGKPGVNKETTQGSIFDSDDSILNYLRTH